MLERDGPILIRPGDGLQRWPHFVCGAGGQRRNPHDGYLSRLAWLAPLVVAVGLLGTPAVKAVLRPEGVLDYF
jgi:hypothetical protein